MPIDDSEPVFAVNGGESLFYLTKLTVKNDWFMLFRSRIVSGSTDFRHRTIFPSTQARQFKFSIYPHTFI